MPFVDQVVHQITTNNLCMKFLWFDEDEAKDGGEDKGEGKDEDKQQSQNQRKNKNLWMPLTMLGGYESVVADLVERGVIKARSLLS